jgi:hypothetical protein
MDIKRYNNEQINGFEKKIFGPTYENGSWKIKTNKELDKLIERENTINFARAQRLGWYGHIERMQDTRMVKAIHTHFKEAQRETKDMLGE